MLLLLLFLLSKDSKQMKCQCVFIFDEYSHKYAIGWWSWGTYIFLNRLIPVRSVVWDTEVGVEWIWTIWVFSWFVAFSVAVHHAVVQDLCCRVMIVLWLKGNMRDDVSIVDHSPYIFYFQCHKLREIWVSYSWTSKHMQFIDFSSCNLQLQPNNGSKCTSKTWSSYYNFGSFIFIEDANNNIFNFVGYA